MITSIRTIPVSRRKAGLCYYPQVSAERQLNHKVNKLISRDINNLHVFDLAKAGHTIIDIGQHNTWYLLKLWRRTGKKGKAVLFETTPVNLSWFKKLAAFFSWNNITIETADFFNISTATVINFNEKLPGSSEPTKLANTLDYYCFVKKIKPDIIKISIDDSDGRMLNGTREIIYNYKPVFMVKCDKRRVGKEKVMGIFNFFSSFSYRGYFVLDTLKIPLENFDFNLYQNPLNNFYCDQFVFEVSG